jgi:hypothetical protein
LRFISMRWLMIALLVSLGALLFVAAGVARHIWLRRSALQRKTRGSAGPAAGHADELAEESDLDREP